jgi:hypothetical protein
VFGIDGTADQDIDLFREKRVADCDSLKRESLIESVIERSAPFH